MKVSVKIHKKVEYWHCRFQLNGKDHRGWLGPTSGMTQEEAEHAAEAARAKAILGIVKPPKQPGPENHQVMGDYLQYMESHRPKQYRAIRHLERHFKFFPNDRLITREDIMAYQIHRMKKGVKGVTVNRDLASYRAAFNRAGVENPFAGFDAFKEHARVRYLTQDELTKLLRACKAVPQSADLFDIVHTAILTGMRKQEILRLHKNQLDFGAGVINVDAENEKGGKNKRIPMPEALRSSFERLVAASDSGYLFESKCTGRPYTDVKKGWATAKKNAGIGNFRFHDLRHTFATYVLLVTKDLRTLQTLLGHSKLSVTEKYAHVLNESQVNAVRQTSDFIGGIIDRDSLQS